MDCPAQVMVCLLAVEARHKVVLLYYFEIWLTVFSVANIIYFFFT
jgi:hypothetical protein